LNGQEFVKQFNAKTAKQKGTILPSLVTFYSDKSFTFVVKSPPASILLAKAAGLQKGSPEANKKKVGKVTQAQCEEIAKIKNEDLNSYDIQTGAEMVKGTARSMGIVVEG
jgi:large subunit ribosomal protein L11